MTCGVIRLKGLLCKTGRGSRRKRGRDHRVEMKGIFNLQKRARTNWMMGRRRPEQSGSSVQLRGTYSMAFHTQHESLLRLHRNLYCFSCHFGNKLSKLHISTPTMANLPLAHFIHIYILLNVTNILNSFCCA